MIAFIALISVLILFVLPNPAHAYIDMGTGSYILQIVLASILTAGVGIKIFWNKIKTFFARTDKSIEHDKTSFRIRLRCE